MMQNFFMEVEAVVGPLLAELGFRLDETDNTPDRGGDRYIAYYRRKDCKLQIYQSSRDGETNCMIAPLGAPNEFGLRNEKWQYLTRFTKRPNLPATELIQIARREYESYSNSLEWVRDRIRANYESAHASIRTMRDN
ncbi:hypothetical protein [Mycolicibacterium smegmatis]|uniref:hypothetical protein n=1 Tax=Mycolicibacterium smegmatis TaxID=1772 RepID=UPI001E42D807|nr:hypothetical protein [Mycolicibacterium smegmatis]MCP2627939.1 hypothetical protein [Mycolicibacterium smegmatis]UGU30589.1 hypothetical protein LT350_29410 [Mycolicibacterium smegmatis]ULN36411.1 hypothetical protein KZ781_05000 [Mycolicibacterium smegmatis]ULN71510.1 hypothetical protein KZ782_06200 [Mycolicibacterium smegmatis]